MKFINGASFDKKLTNERNAWVFVEVHTTDLLI